MNYKNMSLIVISFSLFAGCNGAKARKVVWDKYDQEIYKNRDQIIVPLVRRMPNIPQPYKMRNWYQVSHDLDELLYDLDAKGKYLPLTKLIPADQNPNTQKTGFGFTPYVGPGPKHRDVYEGIAIMGSVLGATVAGIDKSKGEHNWVEMCEQFYNSANGKNMVMNRITEKEYSSFWYMIFPHILFYSLTDRYPSVGNNEMIMKETADKWYQASYEMGGKKDKTGFEYTSFDFDKMSPVDNGVWKEPDAAAGMAWLLYSAYLKFKDPKYLNGTKWCLQSLDDRPQNANPYYEVEMPFGAYAAVRMNAEQGTDYNTFKLVNWCFEQSSVVRPDMGVVCNRWLDNDCYGLVGTLNIPPWRKAGGGYAFAMNTFAMAAPIVPIARYDERYAWSIGKWMLNAANASRLFYANEHPADRQSSPGWKEDKKNVIAYEGIKHHWDGDEKLYATGDPIMHKWDYETDFGLYGSVFVGIFGGIIKETDQKYILQLDLLATDVFREKAYPTYLYFNPTTQTKEVTVKLPPGKFDIYETTTNRFMSRNVSGSAKIKIIWDSAVVVVLAPAGGKVTKQGTKTLINGVVVDYR